MLTNLYKNNTHSYQTDLPNVLAVIIDARRSSISASGIRRRAKPSHGGFVIRLTAAFTGTRNNGMNLGFGSLSALLPGVRYFERARFPVARTPVYES